jgi:hypothetical protein
VLREGIRSSLWGCDRSRIIKNSDKMAKKKMQEQPMASFRPRARTEPTMVKVLDLQGVQKKELLEICAIFSKLFNFLIFIKIILFMRFLCEKSIARIAGP